MKLLIIEYTYLHTRYSRINYVDLRLEVPIVEGHSAAYPILAVLKDILQHDQAIFLSIYTATTRTVAHS